MTRKIILFACAFLLLGLAGLQWVRSNRPQEAISEALVPLNVTVAQVEQRDLPLTISAIGRTEAKASVSVKSRLDGQVSEVAYGEGQPVRKGQLLLRIDPAVLEAQQRQAEGVLARDEAQLAKIEGDYQRNLALMSQGFISQSGLSQSKADLQAAQANLKADRAALDSARLQLGYTRITAPMDGVAGALLLPVGGGAKANDTTLLVINQVQPIYVTFSLPESQLAPVKTAQRKGPVVITASVAGVGQAITGKLAFIDNTVDPTSGAITAKAIFANFDGALTPGLFAQVALQLDSLPNALVVPAQAVESGVDGPYAFVVNADSSVNLRQLKLGPQAGGYQAVLTGLASGERVVMTGQERLRDKGKVTISTAPAASRISP
jgi:multidrug efflux system membrane fusion protein